MIHGTLEVFVETVDKKIKMKKKDKHARWPGDLPLYATVVV